ncbi:MULTISPECIES: GNAT family N-acetyltransferase [Acidiphilium]|uniref:GNAT family N-acetyltransferase n=1 Tax=Acidiphilium TaxID=522 RepID=UPI00257FCA62|nr:MULTISPECIES: GNAT family N-acetyltransferase [Acidiphilium]HQT84283.1 GNAT family N-acetyltransferase [Acidiphilium rubrum]
MTPAISFTARLDIRPLGKADAHFLFESFQDDRLYRYIPRRPPRTIGAMAAEFSEFEAGAPDGSGETWLNWVIIRRDPRRHIGTLQATLFADGGLWIGYMISPDAWGNGFATEAVAWLIGAVQEMFPGRQMLASVDTRNTGSIRVLEKTGFARLRTEPATIYDEVTEDHIYAR